jgi:transposase
MSQREIASVLGCSRSTVVRHMREYGTRGRSKADAMRASHRRQATVTHYIDWSEGGYERVHSTYDG